MSTPIASRKAQEIADKMGALTRARQDWVAATTDSEIFHIHHTQIAAVDKLVGALCSALSDDLAEARRNEGMLAQARNLEETVLGAYQVWEFFRSKLAQRREAQFQKSLRVMDEFAWLCYRPIRDAVWGAVAQCKEPPLVYLNGGWSPFVVVRNNAFRAEAVPRDLLKSADFKTALASLPFPVLGVPWYQVQHLPDALILGHEVGHTIEADFDLQERLDNLIEQAVKDVPRRRAWLSWRSEIFADFFGCLCTGPAFAMSLADFLVADKDSIRVARQEGYPTANLRLLFNFSVLHQLGFEKLAGELKSAWVQMYPGEHPLSSFETDVDPIAFKFCSELRVATALGEKKLTDLFRFSTEQHASAVKECTNAIEANGFDSSDLRVLFAATRLAFQAEPARFTVVVDGLDTRGRLLRQMHASTNNDLRAEEELLPDNVRHDRGAFLEKQGRALFALFRKPASVAAPGP
jgi:hypothetical protein